MGYCPQGHKELDTTNTHTHTQHHTHGVLLFSNNSPVFTGYFDRCAALQAELWEALSFLAFQYLAVLHYAQRSTASVLNERVRNKRDKGFGNINVLYQIHVPPLTRW